MNLWKALFALCILGGGLWLLSPSRGINDEPGVVEISYLGDNGPNAAAMEDAIRVFEADSRAAHARDATKPIYRVVTGQNASRDMTSALPAAPGRSRMLIRSRAWPAAALGAPAIAFSTAASV